MDRRLVVTLLVPSLLLVGGCAEARDTASTVRDCAGLAADAARSGLSGVPTQAEAEQAVQRLDDRIADLDSPDVRAAATALRDRLREVQEAVASADPSAVTGAVASARDAATSAAEACGLSADQFLGS